MANWIVDSKAFGDEVSLGALWCSCIVTSKKLFTIEESDTILNMSLSSNKERNIKEKKIWAFFNTMLQCPIVFHLLLLSMVFYYVVSTFAIEVIHVIIIK